MTKHALRMCQISSLLYIYPVSDKILISVSRYLTTRIAKADIRYQSVHFTVYLSGIQPNIWSSFSRISGSYRGIQMPPVIWDILPIQYSVYPQHFIKKVLLLDCNSEHVAHTRRKKGLFGEKPKYVSNALIRTNNSDCSLRAYLFLSYHKKQVPRS